VAGLSGLSSTIALCVASLPCGILDHDVAEPGLLVLYGSSGRMKDKGPEIARVHSKGASVFHVRGLFVTRIVQYYDRDRAFADLGLGQ